MPLSFFTNSGNSYGSAIPFQRIVEPAQLGFFLNLEQSELLRIQRYNEAWRFYFGRHWLFKREDGEPLVTINYFRKIIDKSVSFLVGKSFVNHVPEALEEISKPFIDEVWEYNKKDQFAYDAATNGAVTGDVFSMVTYEEPSEMQRRLNPFSQGHIRINLLGSEQCYPTWDPLNVDTLIAARVETIYFSERGTRQLDRDDRVNHEGRQLYTKRFTQIMTRDQIVEQYHGDMPVVRPNPLGEIPIIHIRNLSIPKEYYGLPDAADLIDLQRELNEKATDISDVINYHSAPITVITGAKAKQLERGPRQIWSGLPKEARVENLQLGGDLSMATNYWELIKKSLHELSDIPEGALGGSMAISNTSGVALHLTFQPILEKTDRKKVQYQPGFEQINYFILRIGMVMGLINLPFDLCKHCGGRIIDVETDKTTFQWNPDAPNPTDPQQVGYYVKVPVREKKCFHIDKQTLDFTDPLEMRLKFWKEFGFGKQLVELKLKDIYKTMQLGDGGSFWDYTVLQKKLMESWKSENLTPEQNQIHAQVEGMKAFPQETAMEAQQLQTQNSVDNANATSASEASASPGGEGVPPTPPKPAKLQAPPTAQPHPTPPPNLQVTPIPPDEIDVPPEPEHIKINKAWLHPVTGSVVMTTQEDMFVVPTDCRKPAYLNPFKTTVTFLDVLPKDEALQAQLYQTYQGNMWVDAEWCMEHIPEIAKDKTALLKRMKEREQATARLQPAQVIEATPGGAKQETFQEAAPPLPSAASVPGPGGNPVQQGNPNAVV